MRPPVVVIGLGHTWMGDEGVGVAVVERLGDMPGIPEAAEIVDIGTGGLAILGFLEARRKAIIVDCARMGASPGQIRRFTRDQVTSTKSLQGISQHEWDLIKVLQMANALGQLPQDVVIFGIEPRSVRPRLGLSEDLASRIDYYVSLVVAELNDARG